MADIFKQLTGDFFKKKAESVIGVDIGSAFIKVVQLKKKNGKAILETYGELALGPYGGVAVGQATQLPPEKIAEALADVIREANITTKNAGLSLPLQSSLLSFMKMPPLDDKKLAEMIPIEARKYIPVPVSEVSLDWWILPKREEDVMLGGVPSMPGAIKGVSPKEDKQLIDVLVVAILNETIHDFRDVVARAAFENAFFELEVFSTARSTFGASASPVMVIDMGARTTKISILEYGIIRAQHIVNRGSQNITVAIADSVGVPVERAEQLKREFGLLGTGKEGHITETAQLVVDHVLNEAEAVLLNYERTHNRMIKHIVLTGGGVLLKGLYEAADKAFETEVTYADPFKKTEAPAFLKPVLSDAGPEFAVAVGLALRKLEEQE
ncbi:MAG: pilus assembly protein PilM [Candidatus Yonathbacteria bacterium]|nr:pilus assembly protein PilM [Candidatus Yonathbacteria bacterium]NTW47463.1 pilus assembly protein PilM [Candidatus Yonathbacteria bacterium]